MASRTALSICLIAGTIALSGCAASMRFDTARGAPPTADAVRSLSAAAASRSGDYAEFRRQLYHCRVIQPGRDDYKLRRDATDRNVSRCLATAGWEPNGARIVSAAGSKPASAADLATRS